MVSRQETARPLLTQGEVMQLPPVDELVMIAGLAPIRAKKLRYFEDRNFSTRVVPPPVLADGDYVDRPNGRADDWSGMLRAPDRRLGQAEDEAAAANDEGGLQQQRHPGLEEQIAKVEPATQLELPDIDGDEGDAAADKRVMDRVRTSLVRAHAMNQGGGRDLLPGL
jgi:type IV secretion system protein VirD4